MTTNQTAGTTAASPEGASATASGTPGSAAAGGNADEVQTLRERVQKLEQEKQQHLSETETYQRTKRDLEDLQARVSNAANPPTGQPFDPSLLLQQRYYDLAAVMRDPQATESERSAAAWELGLVAQQQQLAVKVDLASVPEAEQAETITVMAERGVNVSTARELLAGRHAKQQQDELERQRAALAKQEAELKAAEEARQAGKVGTAVRTAGAAEVRQATMKGSQWTEEAAQANEKGDVARVKELARLRDSGQVDWGA